MECVSHPAQAFDEVTPDLTLPRTMAEISCGEKTFVSPRYWTCTFGLLSSSVTLNGHDSISFLTVGSSNLLPIRRLTSKTVFSGFIAAWFFAASPMRRSSDVKDTNDGVVKEPCSLATARHESGSFQCHW